MSGWRSARDTVAVETPASRATSAIRERGKPVRSRLGDCVSAIVMQQESQSASKMKALSWWLSIQDAP
jgi:hypothetical protein